VPLLQRRNAGENCQSMTTAAEFVAIEAEEIALEGMAPLESLIVVSNKRKRKS